MSQPNRIQLRRTKGWRLPEGAVSVARPTKWGNPFKVGDPYFVMDFGQFVRGMSLDDEAVRWHRYTAKDAVDAYRRLLPDLVGTSGFAFTEEIRTELKGKDLACWCALDAPCHADVLLELANG